MCVHLLSTHTRWCLRIYEDLFSGVRRHLNFVYTPAASESEQMLWTTEPGRPCVSELDGRSVPVFRCLLLWFSPPELSVM